MYFFVHNETVSRVVTYLDVSEPTVIDWINLIGLMYIYIWPASRRATIHISKTTIATEKRNTFLESL